MTKKYKDRIRLWVKALRSGEFKQCRETLKEQYGNKVSFCCLGVACEVYKKATGKGKWTDDDYDLRFRVGKASDSSDLPEPVSKWFGFTSVDPVLVDVDTEKGDGEISATQMNDTQGASFKKIAKAVEKRYLA